MEDVIYSKLLPLVFRIAACVKLLWPLLLLQLFTSLFLRTVVEISRNLMIFKLGYYFEVAYIQ